jgi:hypothetical protein
MREDDEEAYTEVVMEHNGVQKHTKVQKVSNLIMLDIACKASTDFDGGRS